MNALEVGPSPANRTPWSRGVIERLTIRGTLLLGFGLVFVLWAVSGYDFIVRLADLEGRTLSLNARVTRSLQLLASVRVQVLLGSVYLRDAVIDVTPGAPAYYREELEAIRRQMLNELDDYESLAYPREREMFAELREAVDDFWETALPVLGWDAARRAREAPSLLRERIIPKRDIILKVTGSVQDLNAEAFLRRQTEMTANYRSIQQRVGATTGLALLLSVAVAVLVLLNTGHLEARIREQQARDALNAHDLQRLSARLVEVQEEERRNIARELHDEVGQALTAIKMELSVAERALQAKGEAAAALQGLKTITDRTLQMVRDLSRLLHPRILDDLGLVAALEPYVRDFSRRTGLHAEFSARGLDARFETAVEIAAYRIVQEGLTNIARHAGAQRCRVSLLRVGDSLHLAIEDDGVGFEPASGTSMRRGLGLLGIQERVAGLNGTFRLDTAPGEGTQLTATLPARLAPPPDAMPSGPAVPAGSTPAPAAPAQVVALSTTAEAE